MIKIYKSARELPAAAELVGKFVLKDGGLIIPVLGAPRRVTAVTGSRLYVEGAPMTTSGGQFVPDLKREIEVDGYWSISTVTASCDTIEEVCFLLNARQEALADFEAFKRGVAERFRNFDGKSLEPLGETLNP